MADYNHTNSDNVPNASAKKRLDWTDYDNWQEAEDMNDEPITRLPLASITMEEAQSIKEMLESRLIKCQFHKSNTLGLTLRVAGKHYIDQLKQFLLAPDEEAMKLWRKDNYWAVGISGTTRDVRAELAVCRFTPEKIREVITELNDKQISARLHYSNRFQGPAICVDGKPQVRHLLSILEKPAPFLPPPKEAPIEMEMWYPDDPNLPPIPIPKKRPAVQQNNAERADTTPKVKPRRRRRKQSMLGRLFEKLQGKPVKKEKRPEQNNGSQQQFFKMHDR